MAQGVESLLIVDDQPDNLRVLSAILSEQGYKVRKALDGVTAIESAQAQPPNLILLDVKMPQMDGYEVCAALRELPQTCEIPVIFLSGMDSTADKVKAFAVGGVDYITKPFEAEEVLARVRQHLAFCLQRQQLQQEVRERQQAQAETQLLLTTIQAVNAASDFQTALRAMMHEVTQGISWDYCEAWTPTPDKEVFALNQVYHDSRDLLLQRFFETSQSRTFGYNMGLPGTAWASRQPEWLIDASQATPLFLRSPALSTAGLKAAFAVPIVVDEEVLAVLVFFKRSQSEYDANLVQLVSTIALQVSGFIQRKQAEEALRQANQELQRLANIDGLTQIANRRRFDQVLKQEWKRLRRDQAPLSLILCDIDYFKLYNDHHGHLAGDDCLRQVAQAIQKSVHRPADWAARYGGEEFAVILPSTTAEGALQVAAQIQATLANLNLPHGRSLVSRTVTLSMGIATAIPALESSPEELIKTADRALYSAKAEGRNQYCSDQQLCASIGNTSFNPEKPKVVLT